MDGGGSTIFSPPERKYSSTLVVALSSLPCASIGSAVLCCFSPLFFTAHLFLHSRSLCLATACQHSSVTSQSPPSDMQHSLNRGTLFALRSPILIRPPQALAERRPRKIFQKRMRWKLLEYILSRGL